jgi:hypothetical protein
MTHTALSQGSSKKVLCRAPTLQAPETLKDLVAQESIDAICLLETKLQSHRRATT